MSSSPHTVWEASYFDGVSWEPRHVTVAFTPAGVWVRHADGSAAVWQYREIRAAAGKLSKGPEFVVVADAAFEEAYRHWQARAGRSIGPVLVLATALGVVALLAAGYFWALPAIGAAAAELVPVSVEERFGQAVADSMAPAARRCAAPQTTRALEKIVRTLAPQSPYSFRVIVVDDAEVNALAAPGGYIIVFRGLLERSRDPEEVAGVLAHEMQHVLRRHTTRAIFRELTLWALVASVAGDTTGLLINLASTLGELRFRREDEEQADREGMALIQKARIDPRGMIRFFRSLQEQSGDLPKAARYVSTHPPSAERAEKLEQLAGQARYQPVRLLAGEAWGEIARACAAR